MPIVSMPDAFAAEVPLARSNDLARFRELAWRLELLPPAGTLPHDRVYQGYHSAMRWWWTSLALVIACSGGGGGTTVAQPRPPGVHLDESVSLAAATTPTASEPGAPPHLGPEYLSAGLLEGDVALDEAWTRWRARSATTFAALFEIALLANRARPLETADELMVLALDQAAGASGCDPERLGKIRLLAIAVLGAEHARSLDADLIRLADLGPAECKQR